MQDSILKTSPAVFAVGKEYQISVLVSCEALMWVKVGDECYYDASNGILRSRSNLHKISVPMDKLDSEKKYVVCYRKIIERKPYFTETEDMVEIAFDFQPVCGENIRAYHIADAHNRIEEPVEAVRTYEKEYGKIDFLILNGDIPDHSGSIENFDAIYHIVGKITNGNIPAIFSRGNHDTRGIYAENIADYTPCQNGNSYYSFRLGSIWGLILDCGEDKLDDHPEYGHTICCHAFRRAETEFIKGIIENRSTEYEEEGISHKLIVAHCPFTYVIHPPHDIEQELFSQWAKLLKDNVKPDVMISGHIHHLEIYEEGSKYDHLGQPCKVVVGSLPKENYFAGCGYEFNPNQIIVTFTDSDGQILRRETL